jgi:hypothetical protein
MKLQSKAKCVECSRIFDLLDEEQAGEWYYGHDLIYGNALYLADIEDIIGDGDLFEGKVGGRVIGEGDEGGDERYTIE